MNKAVRTVDWENWGWALLPWLIHLPGLRPIFRFAPMPELVGLLYMAVAVGFSVFLLVPQRRAWLERLLDKRWVFVVGILAITLITCVVYPYADGLKAIGRGSDGDDAMVLGAQSLLQFGNPYHFRTYLGGYLSPGPGWVLLVLPLALSGLYAMIAPLGVALVGWAARAEGIGWGRINLLVGLLFSGLATWEMTTTGIDHIPIALCLLALTMRLRRVASDWDIALFAVLLGMVATSRIVFLYWPLLVAFVLVPQRGWGRGLMIGFIGFFVAAAFHVWGWATSPGMYHPLHLFMKTEGYDGSGGGHFLLVTLAVCVAAGGLMLWKWFRWPAYVLMWIGVFVPLLCAGMGEFLMSGDVGYTTLASYTLLGVPFLLAALLFENDGENEVRHEG